MAKPLLVGADGGAIAWDQSKESVLEGLIVEAFGVATGLACVHEPTPPAKERAINEARIKFIREVLLMEGMPEAIATRYNVPLSELLQTQHAFAQQTRASQAREEASKRPPTMEEQAAKLECEGCDQKMLDCACPDGDERIKAWAESGAPTAEVGAWVLKQREARRMGRVRES